MNTGNWDEKEDDLYRTLSKAEMDALRKSKPKSFSSINGWLIVGIQAVLTLIIAGFCYLFGELTERNVYTYSALVGGLIGFLDYYCLVFVFLLPFACIILVLCLDLFGISFVLIWYCFGLI